jgi:hypothetical protein
MQDMAKDTETEPATGGATPLEALRQACVECCNGSYAEVRACAATACPLWLFRLGRNPTAVERAALVEQAIYPLERKLTGATGLKAIRRRCLDCSGGADAAVRSCAFRDCSLHPFRFGKNPNIVRSPERKEADARRLALLKASALSKCPAGNPDLSGNRVLVGERPQGQSPG